MQIATYALIATIIGAGAVLGFREATHQVDLINTSNTVRANTEIAMVKTCNKALDDVGRQSDEAADAAVLAGAEAAAGAPKITAETRPKVCAVSPYCNK